MVDDELEDAPEPEPIDPLRGVKRLAAAILLRAVEDFLQAKNRETWIGAQRFLFPQDPACRELLRWTIDISQVNGTWLRKRLASAVISEPKLLDFHDCTNCGSLPVSNFCSGWDGALVSVCKRCAAERSMRSRLAHR
jgi:hypothetical protein